MKFGNTLCDIYSKCGDMDAAMQVFENMDERSVVSWTSMIAGYARKGQSDEAIGLFLDMKNERVKPDTFTVTSILHA
nr:pentatricopeptide repeat-containing protein DOT4, chloroplastic [Tanacetum cinerariifolium]